MIRCVDRVGAEDEPRYRSEQFHSLIHQAPISRESSAAARNVNL